MSKLIKGFSKWTKEDKIAWVVNNFLKEDKTAEEILRSYWNSDKKLQQLHDNLIENAITNFYIPFGVAPNFIINGKEYVIPMVTEESSVIAASSLIAKIWSDKGGFKAEVLSKNKVGQVHFMYSGHKSNLEKYFEIKKEDLLKSTDRITENMRNRGGGILEIELKDKTEDLQNYYQLYLTFDTRDAMGANFINSCLESVADEFKKGNEEIEIMMSILSNYVPDCIVRAEMRCEVETLDLEEGSLFSKRIEQVVKIANVDIHRAVTHNKGIMNGIDAIVIATGNDFRAIEAAVHAYASRSGRYRTLTSCSIESGIFSFSIELPLSVGVMGGVTMIHPLSKLSLKMLDDPTSEDLMKIIAVVGMVQNYAALRALVTTGIQKGHMKMHLTNILNQLQATESEKERIKEQLKGKTISYREVADLLQKISI